MNETKSTPLQATSDTAGDIFAWGNLQFDLRAALLVALIALPLCLGIALASNAPLIAGLVAGIVGGIVVGAVSGSHLSVSGPAAGLTVLVVTQLKEIGSFELFLCAVILAGIFQIILGVLRTGALAYFIPSCVIHGMTAAIGLILILKQIPHAIGYDEVPGGVEAFNQPNSENTFTSVLSALSSIQPGAVIISLVGLAILMIWDHPQVRRSALAKMPSSLMVVLMGIALNALYHAIAPGYVLSGSALVQLPEVESLSGFFASLYRPDFSGFSQSLIWTSALTLAAIASIESLLSTEATDKLDPYRRVTPPNRELIAQGAGNICSGFLGGLPVTAVIVRSSANVSAEARSKLSAVIHGIYLFLAVTLAGYYLSMIPIAALAALLLVVGFKLCHPRLFRKAYREGIDQLIPFCTTIVAILLTDLLRGVLIGLGVGFFFVLRSSFHAAVTKSEYNGNVLISFNRDVSFIHKAALVQMLEKIPANTRLLIDGTKARYIDHDIKGAIDDFIKHSHFKNISVTTEGLTSLRHTLKAKNSNTKKNDGSTHPIAA